MSFERALADAVMRPHDEQALEQLANQAIQHAEEERALPLIAAAADRQPNARLLQWKASLERGLDRLDAAMQSLTRAAALAPADPAVAHFLARTAVEAGLPAEDYYQHALRLAPENAKAVIGLAAARLGAGHGEQGERELVAVLDKHPGWTDGHMALANLRSMLGKSEAVTQTLEAKIEAAPQSINLWSALFAIHMKREAFDALETAINRARSFGIAEDWLLPYSAIAAAELSRSEDAERLFRLWNDDASTIWRIRHLLRSGRESEALPLIDAELASERAARAWPYAAIAWRATGDARSAWLEREGELVQTVDLASSLPSLDRLAEVLRTIHICKGEFLDESVRGGTQTQGPLFSRIEPEIVALRAAVVSSVHDYIAALPPMAAGHPLLGPRRDRPVRFAGSWSVRLHAAGYHTSHVHPQGWISSALYVALPQTEQHAEQHAGWLALGKPPPGLKAADVDARFIEPQPGRLVLFPSWMWHGTVPFGAGERLTVAFDVAPPR